MRKGFISPLIIIIIVGLSIAGGSLWRLKNKTADNAPPADQSTTYKNEEFGFQFEYPSGWKVDNTRHDNNLTITLIYSEKEGSIQVWDYSENSIEEIKSRITSKENYTSPATGIKIEFEIKEVNEVALTNGNATEIHLEQKISSEGKQKTDEFYYLIVNPKGKNLLLESKGSRGETVFKKVLETIKYI